MDSQSTQSNMALDFDPNDKEVAMKIVEHLTSNAKQIQENVLQEILSLNVHTEYLGQFLGGRSGKQIFKKKVPVVKYEELKPYIDRITNGEPSDIICAQTITEFIRSSGTSGGAPKLFPTTIEDLERRELFGKLRASLISMYVDGLDQGKGMMFSLVQPKTKTPSGLFAAPAMTRYLLSSHYKNRPLVWYNVNTSPDEVIMCLDNKQSMYCQLLCGLLQREEVLRIGALFATSFIRAIKFLEEYWKELCSNIRTGYISEWITDPSCRASVSSILGGPNPELANLIELNCSKSSWEGIVKKLWPKTKCIETIVTGAMAQSLPILEFYCGGIPLVSTVYGSSECRFGINLNPLCKPCDVSYTFLPNMAYFEFLPVENSLDETADGSCVRKEDKIVDLADVRVGQYYEPVVTTYCGLYRYRVGDILLVTGFHNNAPQFQFVRRQNVVLSIDVDKTTEEDLFKAVTRAKLELEPLGLLLMDYTAYADASTFPGHYVLFWELKQKDGNDELAELDREIMEQCCFTVEESLDFTYRKCRRHNKTIGHLELRVVNHGTFDALMDFFVSKGSSVNQYKTPRCIKSKEALNVLDTRVSERFFSRKTPSHESFATSPDQSPT